MEIQPVNTKKLPGNIVTSFEVKDPPPPEVKKKKKKPQTARQSKNSTALNVEKLFQLTDKSDSEFKEHANDFSPPVSQIIQL